MDRIARLQVAPLKCRVGIEHEICDRERADPVKRPYRETFHQLKRAIDEHEDEFKDWRSIAWPPLRPTF